MSAEEEHNKEESFSSALVNLFVALTTLKDQVIELAKLELRLAGKSLVVIAVLYCAIGFFFISAWFFLLAALAVWLALKFSWLISLLLVAGFNLVLIVLMLLLVAKFKRYLMFPATRRQLNL